MISVFAGFYLILLTTQLSNIAKMSNDSDATTLALEAAIEEMSNSSKPKVFDVTIICTTDDHQAAYWTKRLSEGICRSPSSDSNDENSPDKKKVKTDGDIFPIALAVSEDWAAGGAGNGLGTLYAFQKACRMAKETYDIDLNQLLLDKKVSAAIYHTAGKGTRLAPLPASENNNKPGVVSISHFIIIFNLHLTIMIFLNALSPQLQDMCVTPKNSNSPRCVA